MMSAVSVCNARCIRLRLQAKHTPNTVGRMHLQPFTGRQRQNRRNNCSSTDVAVLANLSVEIPTTDARSCIRFQLVPSGTGQAIVVEAVAEGSSAQQAGVAVGMKLTGISDPVRRDEVWQLQDRPSLRYVRDVLRMRASAYIQLQFEPAQPEVLEILDAAATAAGDSMRLSGSSSSSSGGSSTSAAQSSIDALSSLSEAGAGDTIAERLQQQFEQAQQAGKAMTAVQQRQQRRKDYMEAAKQRDDNGFLAVVAASFVLPALIILLVAYSTGYLDNLYSNSLSNFR